MSLSNSLRALAFALVAAACGSKSPTPAGPTPDPTPTEEEVVVPEGMKFDDMNMDQRAAFMKQKVVPEMGALFREFDGAEFAEFNCKTCHGAGAEDGSFEMPNPDLPVIPGTPEKFQAWAQEPEHVPWMEFMAMKVKPAMAALLQEEEYNPQTQTGEFGCNACHTVEGAPAH